MLRKAVFAILLLSLLVIGTLALVFKIPIVEADVGTIYIRTDGSIDPPTAPIYTTDNITYTLTGNIVAILLTDGIVVERENITVDGVGYTVQGTSTANSGILVEGRNNITIQNITIKEFEYGILLNYSSNANISGNNIENNTDAIHVVASNRTSVVGNNVTNNDEGIHVEGSRDIGVSGNHVEQVSSDQNISISHGIHVEASEHISISGNHVEQVGSSNHTIVSHAIHVEGSNRTSVIGNSVINSDEGIHVEGSRDVSVSGNNITMNGVGIQLNSSSSVSIYHNNFVDNTQQVESESSTNLWDNGYPSGGNYWSDYNGTDHLHGAFQNQTGSDGIGDTPYSIDTSNTDKYPLIRPYRIFSLLGDLNLDGRVDISDAILAALAFGSFQGQPNWNSLADLNNDGIVDVFDFIILASNFGKTIV